MLSQSEGKIFLAAERGHTETDAFRSYNTFSFGLYQHEHKKPFGPLYALNDETLAGGKSVHLTAEEDTLVLLLPLVGGLVATTNEESQFIYAGQLESFPLRREITFNIHNPFDEKLVNYLQLWLKCSALAQSTTGIFSFDLDEKKNNLVTILPADQNEPFFLQATIGKFDGRKEAIYQLTGKESGVMVFVVQGAFEVENRLLEGRDGLALWNTNQVELEALSNEAILLIVEMNMKAFGA